jgi:hypothetical protein
MLIIIQNNVPNFVQLVHLHKIQQIDVYLCVQQILYHMQIDYQEDVYIHVKMDFLVIN